MALLITLLPLAASCGGSTSDKRSTPSNTRSSLVAAPTTTVTVEEATLQPPIVGTDAESANRVVVQRSGLDDLAVRSAVRPVSIRVSGVDIDAGVIAVGANPDDGSLALPSDGSVAAWYRFGPSPGEAGSAVIAAHVDWHGSPGAFFALRSVRVGAPVVVTMVDGSDVRFVITAVNELAKTELPRDEIFSRSGVARLALVTCGGSFDRRTRHYENNVVVYATKTT
jgi:hypothetical protein